MLVFLLNNKYFFCNTEKSNSNYNQGYENHYSYFIFTATFHGRYTKLYFLKRIQQRDTALCCHITEKVI